MKEGIKKPVANARIVSSSHGIGTKDNNICCVVTCGNHEKRYMANDDSK